MAYNTRTDCVFPYTKGEFDGDIQDLLDKMVHACNVAQSMDSEVWVPHVSQSLAGWMDRLQVIRRQAGRMLAYTDLSHKEDRKLAELGVCITECTRDPVTMRLIFPSQSPVTTPRINPAIKRRASILELDKDGQSLSTPARKVGRYEPKFATRHSTAQSKCSVKPDTKPAR